MREISTELTIEQMIRKGMEETRKQKISLYMKCSGEKLNLSTSYPYVSQEDIEKIRRHIDACVECSEALEMGSYKEQKY